MKRMSRFAVWIFLFLLVPSSSTRAQQGMAQNPADLTRVGDKVIQVNEAIGLVQGFGNTFMIRHSETDKIPVVESRQIDYFFHRMFSMIRLLLVASGRGM